MKCSNCGTEFDEGMFCPECGTRVDTEKKDISLDVRVLSFSERIEREMEEDESAFKTIFLQADITNPNSIDKAIVEINERARNNKSKERAKEYVNALNGLSDYKKTKSAIKEYNGNSIVKAFVILLILAIIGFFIGLWFVSVPLIILALALAVKGGNYLQDYKCVTLDGTLIHPTFKHLAEIEKNKKR